MKILFVTMISLALLGGCCTSQEKVDHGPGMVTCVPPLTEGLTPCHKAHFLRSDVPGSTKWTKHFIRTGCHPQCIDGDGVRIESCEAEAYK